jgi:hypothetical protein
MLVALARPVAAQGFISPFIGYNFSGDAGCPNITDCRDKHTNWGASFGAIGSVVGFETEVAYTANFFGTSAAQSTNVLTVMANFMLAPKFGVVQVYGVVGPGWMRTTVESAGQNQDTNQIAWDAGGGIIGYFSQHVGVRGDVRYFHSFQILDLSKFPPFQASNSKLNFGRVAIAAMFKF